MYGGIEYRSRLEARWACFFDLWGYRFTYEPFDGNGYIPDFLLHADPALAEIKPAVTFDEYRAAIPKMTAGLAGHWENDLWILGVDPLAAWECGCPLPGRPAGLLGKYRPAYAGWNFKVLHWGDEDREVRAAWAQACNATKWRGREIRP